MEKVYPLTIVFDRYSGAYSGGVYTAWNLEAHRIPEEIDGGDVGCMKFWYDNEISVGRGETAEKAVESLISKLKQEE
jgi:hypothetical protein